MKPTSSKIVTAQPLTQQVVSYLRDQIIHDVLKPGERIREQLISEQFGISRTPIREALQTLATQRLVDLLPNRGALVVQPTKDELRGMLEVYGNLEGLGAELACRHAGPGDVDVVRGHLRAMEAARAAGDRAAYFQANQEFHLSIIAASANTTLIEMHGHLNMRLYRTRYLAVMQEKALQSASKEHERIMNALQEGDGPGLSRLLRDHLGFAWRGIEQTSEKASKRQTRDAVSRAMLVS